MASAESGGGDGEEEVVSRTNLSIPRGGPIYTSNLMSPLTRVPVFESDVLREIQSLEAELPADCSPPSTADDDDISVDDLKIFTDEELVEMAIKETFKDEQNNGGCSKPCGENLNAGTEHDVCQTEGPQRTNYKGTSIKRTSRKGNKRKMDKHADDSYLVKVNEFLKIKQKQDQDRAAAGLHSLNCQIDEGVSPSAEKAEMLKSLRSTNSRTQQVKPSEIEDFVSVQLPEVVLCVEVYHNIRKYVKAQEFLVLGRQPLTEIRDKIYCATDQVMQRAGQHDPSGYFLLEDVFYNDLRDPSAIDYSEPIFDWLRNSKDDALKKWETCIRGKLRKNQREVLGDLKISELPQFRRADMYKTRFCDLRFRLGAGYLYCHQGDCNHRIVIRDMRLLHPEDVQNRAAYPIVVFQLKYRIEKCAVCKIYRATKMTVDDKWTPNNPCYFCDDCYYLLHHAEDGSLLYSDFLVYDYVHD